VKLTSAAAGTATVTATVGNVSRTIQVTFSTYRLHRQFHRPLRPSAAFPPHSANPREGTQSLFAGRTSAARSACSSISAAAERRKVLWCKTR
jgi:hypothetical protein